MPPPPPKALIYLDQMAVSNMAKALDPDRLKADSRLQFWREIFGILDRLVKLNLILCPTSRIHEKESYVHPLGPEIDFVADHLAVGVSFRFPEEVHLVQLFHALESPIPDSVDYRAIRRQDVLDGILQEWVPPVRIRANIPSFFRPPAHTRAVRDKAHTALIAIWDRWRGNPRPFSERFQNELRAGCDVLVEEYLDHLKAWGAYLNGNAGMEDAVFDPPLLATILPRVTQRIAERSGREEGALEAALDFLCSDAAIPAPYNWNSSLLMAGLARKAESGQKGVNKGTLNDVIALSTVAPYCDAIFMDDAMAGLLQEAPLYRDFITAARPFSNRTRFEFMAFLRDKESQAAPNHMELVRELYRPTRLEPYYDLIVDHRKRLASAGPER